MDIFVIIGIIMGFFSVVVGMIVKGANVAVLINPAAIIIIFVGMIAALINAFPQKEIKRLPKVMGIVFQNKTYDASGTIATIVDLSNLARRDGLLALESSVQGLDNPFLKMA